MEREGRVKGWRERGKDKGVEREGGVKGAETHMPIRISRIPRSREGQ